MSKKTDSLTYEHATEILQYDAENGVLMRKFKSGRWKVCGHKPTHSDGYGMVNVDGKLYLVHRLIWLLVHGEWPEFIDHLDKNPMNNRLENLRAATHIENSHNRGMYKNNTSGYPGVVFHEQSNKYRARITLGGKRSSLDLYSTAEEAFVAYQIAKIEYHPSSPDAQQYLRELTVAG